MTRPLATAARPLHDPRRLFTELGLGPSDAWGRASISRLDASTGIITVTCGAEGATRGPITAVAPLVEPWPEDLAGFVIDWLGALVQPEEGICTTMPVLRLEGVLSIAGWCRRVYEPRAQTQVEIRWHPERGQDELVTRYLPDSTPSERRRAERGLQLLADMRQIRGSPGRRAGHMPEITVAQFMSRYEELTRQRRHARLRRTRPTRAEVAQSFFVSEATIARFLLERGISWPPPAER